MAKIGSQKKALESVRKAARLFLHYGGILVLAMMLLSNFAMAQTEGVAVGGGSFVGRIQNVGLPLSPLSSQQMSTETAQGLPSANPALSPRSQGNNSVVLWDEVIPGKAASPNAAVSGTVTLNIVH